MKIKMYLDMESVRSLCIAHDWCTKMDNQKYTEFLYYAEHHHCDAEHIEVLASLIKMNSDVDSDDPVKTIAFALLNEAVTYTLE